MNSSGLTTIAVLSGKGGVGRSFLTVSLGIALALRNNKVLMIDNNPAVGDLAYLTGVLKEIVFDAADVMKGRCEICEAIYKCDLNFWRREGGRHKFRKGIDGQISRPYFSALHLLPAPREYEDMLSPDVMKSLIDEMSDRYDYVIIDSQSGLGYGFESSIISADKVLLLTTTDPSSVAACRRINDKISEQEIDSGLVINRFNENNFRRSEVYSDLDAVIDDCEVQLISVITEDKFITNANTSLEPFDNYKKLFLSSVRGKKKNPAVTEILNLVERLSGKNVKLCI